MIPVQKYKFTPMRIPMWDGVFNFPPIMLPLPQHHVFDSIGEAKSFLTQYIPEHNLVMKFTNKGFIVMDMRGDVVVGSAVLGFY